MTLVDTSVRINNGLTSLKRSYQSLILASRTKNICRPVHWLNLRTPANHFTKDLSSLWSTSCKYLGCSHVNVLVRAAHNLTHISTPTLHVWIIKIIIKQKESLQDFDSDPPNPRWNGYVIAHWMNRHRDKKHIRILWWLSITLRGIWWAISALARFQTY